MRSPGPYRVCRAGKTSGPYIVVDSSCRLEAHEIAGEEPTKRIAEKIARERNKTVNAEPESHESMTFVCADGESLMDYWRKPGGARRVTFWTPVQDEAQHYMDLLLQDRGLHSPYPYSFDWSFDMALTRFRTAYDRLEPIADYMKVFDKRVLAERLRAIAADLVKQAEQIEGEDR